jgi:hypothetical protein
MEHNTTSKLTQKKKLNIRWIKGHNNIPLNEIADQSANNASLALWLNMTNENTINKNLIESLPEKFLYHNNTIVNEDFAKLMKNLMNLKNNEKLQISYKTTMESPNSPSPLERPQIHKNLKYT